MFKLFLATTLILSTAAIADEVTSRHIDYLDLSHTLHIDSLRSGNHDESGFNEYYFVVTHYGVVANEEARRQPEADRKILEKEGGSFGEIGIKSLSIWKPEDKASPQYALEVPGDLIRSIISETMAEFKVVETQTAIKTEIVMYEKNKKYFFLGDDVEIARTSYFSIPATKFDTPLLTNQELVLEDDKGTRVVVKVEYQPKAK